MIIQLQLVSQTYESNELNLSIYSDPLLDFYINSTEWDLLNLTVAKHSVIYPYPMEDITFYLYIKQKPFFYLFNMILPCVLTLLVSFLAFLVPMNSGEKISISITTLLSICVLLLVISDQLPPRSDYVPLISKCLSILNKLIKSDTIISYL